MARRSSLWMGALLVCATFVAYSPAIRGGLLWDDDAHVTRRELRSLHGLVRIWFELGATQQYYPVLHSAFWAEHRLWGDATPGYHLANLLLHATSACLLAVILRRLGLGGARLPAQASHTGVACFDAPWLAAWIFALHPVCVESVAWISEQKNTLSTVFYLLAALAYLDWRGNGAFRPLRNYWLATGLFALALLSKSVTATLPAALLVVFWWKDGRLSWRRDVAPLLPWFAMGGASGLFTVWVEKGLIGAEAAAYSLGLPQRCLLAGKVVWFYLGKLVWPANLIFIYPRWSVNSGAAGGTLPLIGLLALTAVLWHLRRRSRGPLAALLFFAGSLFPALGFFNVYPFRYSFVADHFQYLAAIGIFSLIAGGWGRWNDRGAERNRTAAGSPPGRAWTACGAPLAAAAAIAALGTLTWCQGRIYRDPAALFGATLERNPDCWMAHTNLGIVMSKAGRSPEAIAQFEEALRLKPDDAEAHFDLAIMLDRIPSGAPGAIVHYEQALRLKPDLVIGHYNLANLLIQAGRIPEAIAHYETALRLDPDFAEAHYRIAIELAKIPGRIPDAIAHYEEALRIRPADALAHFRLATLFAKEGRTQAAIGHLEWALRLDPANTAAREELEKLGSGRK